MWVPRGSGSPSSKGSVASTKQLPDPPADSRDPVLLTALLCRDPVSVLRRLKASNAEIARAAALVTGPEEPGTLEELSVRRWLAQVGGAADDLAELWRLRHGDQAPWLGSAAEIRLRKDPLTRGELAVSGSDLQALGARGTQVGEMLAALLERVLEEPGLNTRDSLVALARTML